jgi:hypothetical protein
MASAQRARIPSNPAVACNLRDGSSFFFYSVAWNPRMKANHGRFLRLMNDRGVPIEEGVVRLPHRMTTAPGMSRAAAEWRDERGPEAIGDNEN